MTHSLCAIWRMHYVWHDVCVGGCICLCVLIYVIWLIHYTRVHMIHLCVTWLQHTATLATHSNTRQRNATLCTWPSHTWQALLFVSVLYSDVWKCWWWHGSFVCGGMAHSYASYDSFIEVCGTACVYRASVDVPWLIRVDVPWLIARVSIDVPWLLRLDVPWLIQVCDMTHLYAARLIHLRMHAPGLGV